MTALGDIQEIKVELAHVRQELQRLTEEINGLKLSEYPTIRTRHPYIVQVEGVCSGWPIIRGTRLTVQALVEKTRLGQTPEEIVTDYSERLTLAHVYDALSYYHENREEIEAQIAANRAALSQVTQLREMRASGREGQ
jgi:uncharacterized protein (DUF433 family)